MSSSFVCPQFKAFSVQRFENEFCLWQYGNELTDKATNNRAEALAILMAVVYYKSLNMKGVPLIIRTDSELLTDTFNDWMANWEKKNLWHKRKNPDLIKTLFNLKTPLMKCEWLKGHGGNEYNEICDYLCTKSLRGDVGIKFKDYEAKYVMEDVIKHIKNSKITSLSPKELELQKKEAQISLF